MTNDVIMTSASLHREEKIDKHIKPLSKNAAWHYFSQVCNRSVQQMCATDLRWSDSFTDYRENFTRQVYSDKLVASYPDLDTDLGILKKFYLRFWI